ncbi:hypothetical protein FA15DRAFT_711395 [Coprinopsis marcescibilis]|uniref:Conserved oligomeric Golgi complex subunit 3 C-terminal domain-containing protein n=1 Tax=Coprinopsis marcescibilis TaxID=230819 RepID=A0A5C3K9S5_COPMA|nr:hypothetical protein FA15DRAFT_711395 [Coprinopsis marcescibilis]
MDVMLENCQSVEEEGRAFARGKDNIASGVLSATRFCVEDVEPFRRAAHLPGRLLVHVCIEKRHFKEAEDVSQTAQRHLSCTRFRSVSNKVAPLLGELERRARSYPDELSSLLAESHAPYFGSRKALLLLKTLEEIKGLDPTMSELVDLGRVRLPQAALHRRIQPLSRILRHHRGPAIVSIPGHACDLLYDDLKAPNLARTTGNGSLQSLHRPSRALMVLAAPISSTSASSTLFSPAIFEDIAQEAALFCRQVLFSARDMIKARPPPSTQLDRDLFLDRMVRKMRSQRDESIRGAKHGIEQGLRRACEEVIASSVSTTRNPIDQWVTLRLQTFSSSDSNATANITFNFQTPPLLSTALRTGVPATSSAIDVAMLSTTTHVAALYAEFRVAIERDLRANVAQIKQYLGDADPELQAAMSPFSRTGEQYGVAPQYGLTAKILIDHIQEWTLESFQNFVDQVREALLGGAQDGEGRDLVQEIGSSQGWSGMLPAKFGTLLVISLDPDIVGLCLESKWLLFLALLTRWFKPSASLKVIPFGTPIAAALALVAAKLANHRVAPQPDARETGYNNELRPRTFAHTLAPSPTHPLSVTRGEEDPKPKDIHDYSSSVDDDDSRTGTN